MQKLSLSQDRAERLHYIKRIFSNAKGADLSSDFAGGRLNGLSKLHSLDIAAYVKNRHFLNGSVSHLSPYLRHGCITLNETFNFVNKKYGMMAEKFIMQLAWRDYWRQVWFAYGDAIYSEMEPAKAVIHHEPLADDIKTAKTGLACMDAFVKELYQTGYVHHHARLWLANYIVHHRKINWREAADWFEALLLDGDIASNHLSWQWVASTFSSRPYLMNKETISRFTGNQYCDKCFANCPFNASETVLSAKLFNTSISPGAKQFVVTHVPKKPFSLHAATAVYVHDEMMSSAHALFQNPFPKIFIFDPLLHGAWSLNRLQFVSDCLSEINGIEVWYGDTAEVLMKRGVGRIITQDTPNRRVRELLEPFVPKYEPVPKLAIVDVSSQRLMRFSRYWEKVSPYILRPM